MTNTTVSILAAVGLALLLVETYIIPDTEAALPIMINLHGGKQGPPGRSGQQGTQWPTHHTSVTGAIGQQDTLGKNGNNGTNGSAGPHRQQGVHGIQIRPGVGGGSHPQESVYMIGPVGQLRPQGNPADTVQHWSQDPMGPSYMGGTGGTGVTGVTGLQGLQGPQGETGANSQGSLGQTSDTGGFGPIGSSGQQGPIVDTGLGFVKCTILQNESNPNNPPTSNVLTPILHNPFNLHPQLPNGFVATPDSICLR
ncbi:hypothetical protein [Nitrososphaera sp. AFS]|uniref:hypothetical protein n=1 Tax=Nitrososphaera sp. AFS TaxID=2301191 RepID=UPI0013924798|nr:hypothetical protein [Nitrososphaera sp. AFS]NAL78233.1 hypothetical protein [Nitrososphaera sp. AFS]